MNRIVVRETEGDHLDLAVPEHTLERDVSHRQLLHNPRIIR